MSDIRPQSALLVIACMAVLAALGFWTTCAWAGEPDSVSDAAQAETATTGGADEDTSVEPDTSATETAPNPETVTPVVQPVGDPVIVDAVYAVVDNRVITVSEIVRKIEPVIEQVIENNPSLTEAEQLELRAQFFAKVASDMVVKALLIKAARDEGIVVDEARVGSQIRRLLVNEGVTLEEYLDKNRMTYQELFREVHDDYLFGVYRQVKIIPRVYVSPGDVAAYYEAHKDEAEFLTLEQVRCHEIVLFGNDDERRSKTTAALDKLRAGAEFAEVTKECSENPGTVRSGGDRGWITRMVINSDKVNTALFDQLEVGEVSDVIEDEKGFLWIVMISGRREAVRTPLAQAYEKIERRLRRIKTEEEILKYAERLKKTTAVVSNFGPQ